MIDKININNQKISLENVSFERLGRPSAQPKAIINDEILDFSLIGNKISFKYKRILEVIPSSIYKVSVLFSYESEIITESIELLKANNQFTKEYLESRAAKMVESTSLCAVASQIISNLTAINGNRPFISPPVFIKKS